MLRIDDILPKVWVPHEPTGTRYQIQALEPKDGQRLLKAATDPISGEVDNVKYNGLAADHMIVAWEGVGQSGAQSECTPEARIKLGERYPRIVSALIEKATNMKMFSDEAEAGKNV